MKKNKQSRKKEPGVPKLPNKKNIVLGGPSLKRPRIKSARTSTGGGKNMRLPGGRTEGGASSKIGNKRSGQSAGPT